MTRNCSQSHNTDVSDTCPTLAARQEMIITPLTDKKAEKSDGKKDESSDKRCCGGMKNENKMKSGLSSHVRWR